MKIYFAIREVFYGTVTLIALLYFLVGLHYGLFYAVTWPYWAFKGLAS